MSGLERVEKAPSGRFMLSLCLVLVGAVVLAACGGDDSSGDSTSDSSASGEEAIKTAVLLFGNADDQSWNTSMADSIEIAAEESNLDVVSTVESVTAADGVRAEREAIEQGGAELVIVHASALDQATQEVAAEFPDTCFIQAFGQGDLPNVTNYVDDATGVNYLAGMAAAAVSESGTLGTVGGVDLDEIVASVDAFEQGAKAVDPKTENLVTWVGDFEDPLKGKEAGAAQIQQGADVVYAYGDGTGLGTVEAAVENSVPTVGAWSDQYDLAPDLMVTSFVSNWEPIINEVAEAIRTDGAANCGQGTWAANLENGGTELAPFNEFEDDIPDDVKQQIDDAREQIIAGELDPVTGKSSGSGN